MSRIRQQPTGEPSMICRHPAHPHDTPMSHLHKTGRSPDCPLQAGALTLYAEGFSQEAEPDAKREEEEDAPGLFGAPAPKPLTPALTHRGFHTLDFEDANGIECSLQESSIASATHIWLGASAPNATIGPPWCDYELPKNVSVTTRMHLSQAQAGVLATRLKYFAEYGQVLTEAEAARAREAEKAQGEAELNAREAELDEKAAKHNAQLLAAEENGK